MKVTRVRASTLKKEVPGELWNPQTKWREKEAVAVLVEADAGFFGVGEAWTVGGSSAPVVALIEDLSSAIVGQDPEMISALWHHLHRTNLVSAKGGILYHAMSAIDIALWDLIGKAHGQPIHKSLGGHSSRLPVYASAGLYGKDKSERDLGDEMVGYVAHGFRALKMKVGGLSVDDDLRRIAAVREAVGPQIRECRSGASGAANAGLNCSALRFQSAQKLRPRSRRSFIRGVFSRNASSPFPLSASGTSAQPFTDAVQAQESASKA